MKLSQKSIENLCGVHPDLIAVVMRAIEITAQNFSVLCGVRTAEEQAELYAQGRTKPGRVVTWTLKTNHAIGSDGFGHAVDLVPYPVDWGTLPKFDAIASAMMLAAEELGVTIRWGADWDMDGLTRERGESDSPHFEIIAS